MENQEELLSKTEQTINDHRHLVRKTMEKIVDELQARATTHDLSKYREDEFEGYTYFNKLDPNLKYGSDEYKEAMVELEPYIKEACELHYKRNSHHPEYHYSPQDMPLLDIIEMVCDWYAASQTYSSNTEMTAEERFNNSLRICIEKYNFRISQIWVINEVAKLLKEIK